MTSKVIKFINKYEQKEVRMIETFFKSIFLFFLFKYFLLRIFTFSFSEMNFFSKHVFFSTFISKNLFSPWMHSGRQMRFSKGLLIFKPLINPFFFFRSTEEYCYESSPPLKLRIKLLEKIFSKFFFERLLIFFFLQLFFSN